MMPNKLIYGVIVEQIAAKRPVRALDFANFIGRSDYGVFDEERGGYVTRFTVRRVLDENTVEILVELDPCVPGGTLMHIDADDLAIRMEAA